MSTTLMLKVHTVLVSQKTFNDLLKLLPSDIFHDSTIENGYINLKSAVVDITKVRKPKLAKIETYLKQHKLGYSIIKDVTF